MKRVILDCDNTMGLPFKEIDDGLTLLYLLGCPDTELLGVTGTFGNGSASQSVRQTRKLLTALGRMDIPVFEGADRRFASPTDAARFLAQTAAAHPGEISLLATGPLGNLRGAFELDAQFFENLNQIACMGGYLKPLHIGKREISELNLSADPEASHLVLNAPCPVALMNAQVCLQASFRKPDLAKLKFWPQKYRRMIRQWLFGFGTACGVDEFYLWDLLPAVYLTKPELFSNEIVEIGSSIMELESGSLLTVENAVEPNVTLPSKILDIDAFKAALFQSWERVSIPGGH